MTQLKIFNPDEFSDENKPIISSKNKTEIYLEYKGKSNLCYNTFLKWMKTMPFWEEISQIRVLPPKYVEKIYAHLGNP